MNNHQRVFSESSSHILARLECVPYNPRVQTHVCLSYEWVYLSMSPTHILLLYENTGKRRKNVDNQHFFHFPTMCSTLLTLYHTVPTFNNPKEGVF